MGFSQSPTSAQSSILQSRKYPTEPNFGHLIFIDNLTMGAELDDNYDVQDAARSCGEVDAEPVSPSASKQGHSLLCRPRLVLCLRPVGEAGHRRDGQPGGQDQAWLRCAHLELGLQPL